MSAAAVSDMKTKQGLREETPFPQMNERQTEIFSPDLGEEIYLLSILSLIYYMPQTRIGTDVQ